MKHNRSLLNVAPPDFVEKLKAIEKGLNAASASVRILGRNVVGPGLDEVLQDVAIAKVALSELQSIGTLYDPIPGLTKNEPLEKWVLKAFDLPVTSVKMTHSSDCPDPRAESFYLLTLELGTGLDRKAVQFKVNDHQEMEMGSVKL